MKLKIKPAWIGLLLIAVMLFSTIAGAIIQSLRTGQNVQLPKSNIIDYRIDASLRSALIQYGSTMITFDYNSWCENCVNQKSFLESLAQNYEKQIFLEELVDNSLSESKITIASVYGEQELVNANETEIFSVVCDLMVEPPAICVL